MTFYTYHFSPTTHEVTVTRTADDQTTAAPKRVGTARNYAEAATVAKKHYEKLARARKALGHPEAQVFYP